MTKEQANALAALVRSHFGLAYVQVLELVDKRNAPQNWFVAVSRSWDDKSCIILYRELDWHEVINAYAILKDLD